jgi:bacterioferritin-associated ferredoxin
VYICLCNGLTDGQIARVVAEGAARPREVYTACDCRARCGGCTRTIVSFIHAKAGAADGAEARG